MGSISSHQVLLNAVRGLLRPIARLCIRNSIKLNEVLEMLKSAFVDVATQELLLQGKASSGSRISVMSGVHRKDVSRIQSEQEGAEKAQNLISKVIVHWRHQRAFTTKSAKPRVLSCEGKDSDFAKLIESVNGKNISPYTVLFEMERMGVVSKKNGKVKLQWRDYVCSESIEEGLEMLIDDSNDLISAVEENLFDDQSANNLHLKTEYDRIPASAEQAIRKWFLEEGSKFHLKAKRFLSRHDLDFNGSASTDQPMLRASLGTFSLVTRVQDVFLSKESAKGD